MTWSLDTISAGMGADSPMPRIRRLPLAFIEDSRGPEERKYRGSEATMASGAFAAAGKGMTFP